MKVINVTSENNVRVNFFQKKVRVKYRSIIELLFVKDENNANIVKQPKDEKSANIMKQYLF